MPRLKQCFFNSYNCKLLLWNSFSGLEACLILIMDFFKIKNYHVRELIYIYTHE